LNVLASGLFSILTTDGVTTYRGPCIVVTEACDKKAGYAHEDTVWIGLEPQLDLADSHGGVVH